MAPDQYSRLFWLGLTQLQVTTCDPTDWNKMSSCNCQVQGVLRQGWVKSFKQLFRTLTLLSASPDPEVYPCGVRWFPVSPGLQCPFQFWQNKGLFLYKLSIEVYGFSYVGSDLPHMPIPDRVTMDGRIWARPWPESSVCLWSQGWNRFHQMKWISVRGKVTKGNQNSVMRRKGKGETRG